MQPEAEADGGHRLERHGAMRERQGQERPRVRSTARGRQAGRAGNGRGLRGRADGGQEDGQEEGLGRGAARVLHRRRRRRVLQGCRVGGRRGQVHLEGCGRHHLLTVLVRRATSHDALPGPPPAPTPRPPLPPPLSTPLTRTLPGRGGAAVPICAGRRESLVSRVCRRQRGNSGYRYSWSSSTARVPRVLLPCWVQASWQASH
mmetsp:Transcript_20645/g.35259  ORF Transcript_20645/g.35259 Transcript_20645/m.35259 type:complete len:203 (+) Transcript_20645:981-1589(+)